MSGMVSSGKGLVLEGEFNTGCEDMTQHAGRNVSCIHIWLISTHSDPTVHVRMPIYGLFHANTRPKRSVFTSGHYSSSDDLVNKHVTCIMSLLGHTLHTNKLQTYTCTPSTRAERGNKLPSQPPQTHAHLSHPSLPHTLTHSLHEAVSVCGFVHGQIRILPILNHRPLLTTLRFP